MYEMCFTLDLTIRRTPKGLVQERPLPARPVPAAEAVKDKQPIAKTESYDDPFADLILSSSSSSGSDQTNKTASQPKVKATAKVPVKKKQAVGDDSIDKLHVLD